jgi:hypothetical protein
VRETEKKDDRTNYRDDRLAGGSAAEKAERVGPDIAEASDGNKGGDTKLDRASFPTREAMPPREELEAMKKQVDANKKTE